MADYLDNPAGRLLPVLSKLRFGAGPVVGRLGRALELDDTRPIEMFRQLSLLVAVPDEIANQLEKYTDIDPGIIQAVVHEVTEFFLQVSTNFYNDVGLEISEGTVARLEDWSYRLHQTNLDRIPDKDTLSRLLKSIDELISILDHDKELDAHIQEFLRYHLAILARAVVDVRVRGMAALEEALDLTLGRAFRTGIDFSADLEVSPNVKSRFWEILGRVSDLLQVGSVAVPLTAALLAGNVPAVEGVEHDPKPAIVLVQESTEQNSTQYRDSYPRELGSEPSG